jgi:hypothetical protein
MTVQKFLYTNCEYQLYLCHLCADCFERAAKPICIFQHHIYVNDPFEETPPAGCYGIPEGF